MHVHHDRQPASSLWREHVDYETVVVHTAAPGLRTPHLVCGLEDAVPVGGRARRTELVVSRGAGGVRYSEVGVVRGPGRRPQVPADGTLCRADLPPTGRAHRTDRTQHALHRPRVQHALVCRSVRLVPLMSASAAAPARLVTIILTLYNKTIELLALLYVNIANYVGRERADSSQTSGSVSLGNGFLITFGRSPPDGTFRDH